MQTFADSAERAAPEAIPPRLWRGTALLVVGRVWGSACTLTALWLLTKRLPPGDLDTLTFYLAIFLWLDAFVVLGTGQIAVQCTAADPGAVYGVVRATRRIRIATGLVGATLVGGAAFLAGEPGAGWILVAALYPITHALEVSTTVLQNRLAWKRPVLIRATAATLSLAFVVLLYLLGTTEPAPYLVAIALGSTLGNFLLHAATRGSLPRSGPSASAWRLFAMAIPLGLSGLCAQTYFYIDNLFLREYAPEGELGRYNVAVRFLSVFIMVAQFVGTAGLPWLARRHAAGGLGNAVDRLGPPLFAAAGLGVGLVMPWRAPLLELFEPGFEQAAPALGWLLLAVIAIYAGAVLLTAVVASGSRRAVLAITAIALAVNLLGNAWLVPTRGSEGAALTTFATEVVVVCGALLALARVGAGPSARHAWRWLGGPLAFFGARALSGALPLG